MKSFSHPSSIKAIRAVPVLAFAALAASGHRSTPTRGTTATPIVGAHPAPPAHRPPPPPLTTTRGAFIGVSVANLDASVRWYSEKLGLDVVMRPPKIEKSTAVILEGGGLIVELMHHDDAVPLSTAAPAITRNFLVHGIFKSGIIVDDFDKSIEQLRARGVTIAIGPFPATAEQRANAIIRDNEGNFIQLFSTR